jgi:hypothetical protein
MLTLYDSCNVFIFNIFMFRQLFLFLFKEIVILITF